MAHRIEINSDGTANAAFGRFSAWHGLGTVFDTDMTPDQALIGAQLNGWNVRLARSIATELYTVNAAEVELLDAEPVIATRWAESDKFHTVRTNPVTGAMEVLGSGRGAGFTVVQNEELLNLLDALVGGGARISAAGSLRGGTQVFFCMELPADIWVGGFDQVKTYLTIMNGHDGSLAVKAVASPVRVVCANTQEAALDSAMSSWVHRHTKGVTNSVAQAQHDLDLTFAYATEATEEFERMIQEPFTTGEFDLHLKSIFGDPEKADTQRSRTISENKISGARAIWINGGPTMDAIAGTRWAAWNAVTEFIDHKWGRAQDRALRSVDGQGAKLRQASFDLLRVPA